MKQKKGLVYYLYCALGEKSHQKCNKTSDRVALIRLLMFLSIFITNAFIVFGVVKTHFFPREVKCVTVEKPSIAN
jgi:hypothetical protein